MRRDAEIKPGGAISEKGCRHTFRVESKKDLSRDVLKSDSCAINIPELDFNMGEGTLGGKYTTIEVGRQLWLSLALLPVPISPNTDRQSNRQADGHQTVHSHMFDIRILRVFSTT